MAYTPKDGSGSLFKNTRKEKDTHPDYRGDLMLDGTMYEVAAWIKEGKNGKFMSLSAKPKEEASTKPAPSKERGQQKTMDDMDSDVPF
jgi:hypothetical protein